MNYDSGSYDSVKKQILKYPRKDVIHAGGLIEEFLLKQDSPKLYFSRIGIGREKLVLDLLENRLHKNEEKALHYLDALLPVDYRAGSFLVSVKNPRKTQKILDSIKESYGSKVDIFKFDARKRITYRFNSADSEKYHEICKEVSDLNGSLHMMDPSLRVFEKTKGSLKIILSSRNQENLEKSRKKLEDIIKKHKAEFHSVYR